MAIAFVQGASNAASGVSSLAKAFTSNNTAGNTIIVSFAFWKSGGFTAVPTVTDTRGNTYHRVGFSPNNLASQAFVFVAYNCAGGANTVTVGLGTSADTDMSIHEYSGCASVNALDQNAYFYTPTSPLTMSMTTQYANEVLFCFAYNQTSGSSTFTPSAGWTGRESTSNPGAESSKSFDQIVSSTGTYSNSIAVTGTSNGLHLVAISLSDTAKPTGFIQSAHLSNASTSSGAIAFPASNGSGNVLIAAFGLWSSTTVATPTVSDSKGNTWTLIASTPLQSGSGQSKAYLYCCTSCAAGTNTVTVSLSAACAIDLAIHEYAPTAPAIADASNSVSTPTVTTSAIATAGGTTMFGFSYDQSDRDRNFVASNTGAGWVQREMTNSSASTSLITYDQAPAVGSYGLSVTISVITHGLHAAVMSFNSVASTEPFLFIAT